jgi:hypothetical protein
MKELTTALGRYIEEPGLSHSPFRREEKKLDISETFIKLDNGKNMLSLIEPQFVLDLGKVVSFGANKYKKDNWKLCTDTSRYEDALLRHIYAHLSGEKNDPESKLPHLAHASCNLMFLQYFDNLNTKEIK